MASEYDRITAYHYSAYRPGLHRLILNRCIPKNTKLDWGLDIGCGTGQSAIALAEYCQKVIATDPSAAMLEKSITHAKVTYHLGNGESLDFPAHHFDIVTFAGSLYYAKSQKLLDEVIKVSNHGAKIIVYDFEILLDAIRSKLDLERDEKEEIHYNHQENFSGLKNQALAYIDNASEEIALDIPPSNLAHLLLSEKNSYDCLSSRLGNDTLYDKLKNQLVVLSGGEEYKVKANLFYSIYECDSND